MKTTKKVSESKEVKNEQAIQKVLVKKGSEKNAIERPLKVKDKNYLYKFQTAKGNEALTEKEEKKKRSKLRRDLQLLINKIITDNLKKKDLTACKDFISFYKENYILNDFEIKSITNSSDELKVQDLTKVLALCKESLTKK